MALENNSPTFTYVRYEGMQIIYEGEIYQVQNSHSNKKYLYWSVRNPYQLEETNVRKSEVVGEYLVIINDKGISTMPPHTDITVNFDGNNPDLIMDKVFGIYETVDGMGDRFVSIETSIDGISTTVGQIQEEQGSMSEKVSQIDQKVDSIDLSVKEVEREFAENKEFSELRESLNKSIIDFNSNLGIFKSEISGHFKDNKISNDEKVEINTHISVLELGKADVVLNVNKVILIAETDGQTTIANSLKSAKTKFENSVDNLKTYITTAISDGTIVPSEITAITDLFGKCNTSINKLKNTCDEVIFLGAGGSISTELARIGIKSDEILLQVSKTEDSINSNLSLEKITLTGHIKDVENAFNSLRNSVNKLSEDGKITTEEKQIILDRISSVTKENNDLHSIYDGLYNNIHISVSIKDSMKMVYDEYSNSFASTKSYIENSMTDNIIDDIERNNIGIHILSTLTKLSELHKKMSNAMDDININTQKAEVESAKEELRKEVNDVYEDIRDLNDYMDGAFKDGIITHAEKKILEEKLRELDKEKIDVDSKYKDLYNNPDLEGGGKDLKIHFIKTNDSGDCILIQSDNGKNILVDSNEKTSSQEIIQYMKNVGVVNLDYVFVTHHHSDHCDGMPTILDAFTTNNCTAIFEMPDWSKLPPHEVNEYQTNQVAQRFLNKVKAKGIRELIPTEKQKIQISDNTYIEIYNTKNTNYNNYNNLSLVLLIVHRNKKYCLLGDIYKDAQTRIETAIGTVDVVKANHHDYDYVSDDTLYYNLNFRDGVITSPAKKDARPRAFSGFCQYYEKRYFGQYDNGTIVLTSTGNSYSLNCKTPSLYTNAWWDWQKLGKWYYFKNDGKYARNESLTIDGKEYSFDETGLCLNP